MKFFLLFCIVSLLIGSPTVSHSQQRNNSNFSWLIVQGAEPITNPVEKERKLAQFWNWYVNLDSTKQKGVNAFIQAFLLNIKLNPSDAEELSIFSDKRSLALKISRYVEQAKHEEQLRSLLICVASAGGSNCDPSRK